MIDLSAKIISILKEEGVQGRLDSPIDSKSKRIPFIHDFPKNCCEYASIFFGIIAKKNRPKSEVMLIEGKHRNERHFWLSIDGLIYDITADQFIEHSKPLIGVSPEIANLLMRRSEERRVGKQCITRWWADD